MQNLKFFAKTRNIVDKNINNIFQILILVITFRFFDKKYISIAIKIEVLFKYFKIQE